jgi:hypothetical protein
MGGGGIIGSKKQKVGFILFLIFREKRTWFKVGKKYMLQKFLKKSEKVFGKVLQEIKKNLKKKFLEKCYKN